MQKQINYMNIVLNKKYLLICALLCIFSLNCKPDISKRTIVFSKVYCKGCIEDAFQYIINRHLDKQYKIVLDSNSYYDILPNYPIQFTQMSNKKIKNTYGDFGNFILIDSTGKKTEFLTDMKLQDYIH